MSAPSSGGVSVLRPLSAPLRSSLLSCVAEHGSPLYVYHLPTVRARCASLRAALSHFPRVQLLYAMKSNGSAPVLREVLGAGGFGAECVSEGEVRLALACGARRVLYTANNVSVAEFGRMLALQRELSSAASASSDGGAAPAAGAGAGVASLWINCDSVQRISDLPPGAQCFLRVNGSVGSGHHAHVITCGPASKFGIALAQLPEAIAAAAAARVHVVGLHQHVGSGASDVDVLCAAAEVLCAALERHAAELPALQYVDFGGGIGVPYRPQARALDLGAYGVRLCARFEGLCAALRKPLTLVLEPGRFPSAEAGFLLATVNTVKETPFGGARTWLGVDTGFNHLVRPSYYGAYHHISNISAEEEEEEEGGAAAAVAPAGGAETAGAGAGSQPPSLPRKRPLTPYIVVGNICESGDVFTWGTKRESAVAFADDAAAAAAAAAATSGEAEDDSPVPVPRLLPAAVRGDVLAFHTAGAYGFSMASEYNMRPRPAEIVLDYAPGTSADGGGEEEDETRPLVARVARKAKTVQELVAEALG